MVPDSHQGIPIWSIPAIIHDQRCPPVTTHSQRQGLRGCHSVRRDLRTRQQLYLSNHSMRNCIAVIIPCAETCAHASNCIAVIIAKAADLRGEWILLPAYFFLYSGLSVLSQQRRSRSIKPVPLLTLPRPQCPRGLCQCHTECHTECGNFCLGFRARWKRVQGLCVQTKHTHAHTHKVGCRRVRTGGSCAGMFNLCVHRGSRIVRTDKAEHTYAPLAPCIPGLAAAPYPSASGEPTKLMQVRIQGTAPYAEPHQLHSHAASAAVAAVATPVRCPAVPFGVTVMMLIGVAHPHLLAVKRMEQRL